MPPNPPPNLPPPPTIADKINYRFRNYQPGEGTAWESFPAVIVHGIDHTEDPTYPYMVCSPESPDCGFLSDRMSASVIWKGKGAAAFGGGGFLLNPNHTRILCIYGGDGGTRGKLCRPPGVSDDCIPGCKASPFDQWCDGAQAGSSWCDGKAWRPNDLGQMLALDEGSDTYNEAILDGYYWNAQLPHSIEAVLTSPNNPVLRRMHQQFLRRYGVTAEQIPLLTFHKEDLNTPFRVDGEGGDVWELQARAEEDEYRRCGCAAIYNESTSMTAIVGKCVVVCADGRRRRMAMGMSTRTELLRTSP